MCCDASGPYSQQRANTITLKLLFAFFISETVGSRLFSKGVSKEEFIKNTSIPGVTEWTDDGIQRPLTAAYEELTEKKTM
jgi:hypothetical protein